jgi:N-acetylmuramoyl-L-alanine amidase
MTVRLGNRAAAYGGLEFWLGFAPKLIRGLPYVHSLDARKTLQPLLGEPSPFAWAGRTVAIDPGHGGKDSGARSCVNGEYEKQYTLDLAKRLQRLLLANGWNAVLTRSNDTYVALGDRVAVADQIKADLFLSLHFNSGAGSGAQFGIETYCLTPSGMPSNLLRNEGDDPRQRHPNNAFDEENFQLALRVHRAVLMAAGTSDRGVRRARFMGVLRGQTRPAILIEAGYLTNPAEARKIATAAHRQTLAEGIARGLE